MAKKKQERVGDALLKVALGCTIEEVTEEYAEVDGELKLTKRKEIKKDIPPDLKAVQLLLAENTEFDYTTFSDERLEEERQRLLTELKTKEEKQRKKNEKTGSAEKDAKTAVKSGASESAKAAVQEDGAVKKRKRPKPRKRVVRKAKK